MTLNAQKIILNEERNVQLTVMLQAVDGEFGAIHARPAILILPGGGYEMCSDREAEQVAYPYMAAGYHAFVLRYSVKEHKDWPNPLNDYEQAMQYIEDHADEWHVKTDKIVVAGFSAGGHLASTVATHAASDVKPNFQILFYPVISMKPDITHHESHDNLLGRKPGTYLEELYSNDMQVSASTPRAFIMLSDDDDVVMPANSINYYSALLAHKIPAALYVYPSGGHGYGIYTSFPYHLEMLLELKGWLASF